jgi:hypothetical protein
MAEGVLGMECLSPWKLCEGNLEGGAPSWGPRRIFRKVSGAGISLNRGSAFGEPGGGIVYLGL